MEIEPGNANADRDYRVTKGLLATIFLSIALNNDSACAQSADNDILIGTWEARRVIGPRLQGPVDIWRDESGWSSSVNAEIALGTLKNGAVQFEFGSSGALKLRLDDREEPLMGAWVQPPVAWLGSQYVSPVHLSDSHGVWSGNIAPAPDVVTLRLTIARSNDGELQARLLNPEQNIGHFVKVSSVRTKGNSIEIVGTLPSNPSEQVAVLRGEIHAETGPTLTLYFGFLYPDGAFTFSRVDSQPVQGGTYRPPPSTGDGWTVGNARDFGINLEKLSAYREELARLANDDVASFKPHAFLVARSGVLIVEDYFEGHNRELTHDTRSATKTVASILAGAAAYNGVPISVDTLVYNSMFDGTPPTDLDPRASQITLAHLMTMTAGLDCDDWEASSPGREGAMQSQSDHRDWAEFTLALDMINAPGEHAAYCAGSSNLVGAVVSRLDDKPSQEQFERYIARPMQITEYQMNLMANGEPYFGGGMRFKPRDFAKFGQLIVNGGVWNGRRVLSEDWVRQSTEPTSFLYDENDWHDSAIGYGYLWWIYDYPYSDTTVRAVYMAGNGGQYVFAVPALELVIVLMGGSYGDLALFHPRDDHMPNWILPMVR